MINTIEGNLLELQKGILVHGCNCHGVMGSGIAKLIRDKWPDVYRVYRREYLDNRLWLGDVISVANPRWRNLPTAGRHVKYIAPSVPEDVIIVNAMTQFDFGREPGQAYVDYEAISACFSRVRMLALTTGLDVHFPLIGCGLAQGKWDEVSARIEAALGPEISANLWVLPST